MIEKYKDHTCILKIKPSFGKVSHVFHFEESGHGEVQNFKLNISKATGADDIPPNLLKASIDRVTPHITNILNNITTAVNSFSN